MPHWDRDEPQFFDIFELPWREVAEIEIARGVEGRLISKDQRTGAATAMLQLPAGWAATDSGRDATLELFVLDGDLTIDGETLYLDCEIDADEMTCDEDTDGLHYVLDWERD